MTPELLRYVDRTLPHDGSDTLPSPAQFTADVLFLAVDRFRDDWDNLPQPIVGRPDYRCLWLWGIHNLVVYIEGQLSPVDGAVELTAITIAPVPADQLDNDEDRGET